MLLSKLRPFINKTRNIFLKNIYYEVTEDIFDMSKVRIFKEIEKKKLGDVYTLLCLRSAELSKAFSLYHHFTKDCSARSGPDCPRSINLLICAMVVLNRLLSHSFL